MQLFERRDLLSTNFWTRWGEPHVPQEKTFAALNESVWNNGSTIYRKGKIVGSSLTHSYSGEVVLQPEYAHGLWFDPGAPSLSQLYDYMFQEIPGTVGTTYDGLWNDFYCSLTKQISESPFISPEIYSISSQ